MLPLIKNRKESLCIIINSLVSFLACLYYNYYKSVSDYVADLVFRSVFLDFWQNVAQVVRVLLKFFILQLQAIQNSFQHILGKHSPLRMCQFEVLVVQGFFACSKEWRAAKFASYGSSGTFVNTHVAFRRHQTLIAKV